MKLPIVTALLAWAKTLRFQQLFWLTGALFIADLIVPDMVPFADEALLGLMTLLFASWKDKRSPNESGGSTTSIEVDSEGNARGKENSVG